MIDIKQQKISIALAEKTFNNDWVTKEIQLNFDQRSK